MLDANYHLKVIDFGDATYIESAGEDQEDLKSNEGDLFKQGASQERRGTFVGTAFYVSPEMLNDNISCPESDLWALGCIIYQMFTGEVPFSGATDYATF